MRFLALTFGLAILASVVACGGNSASEMTFGGTVPNSNALFAMVTDGSRATAYICDGSDSGVNVAEWFTGEMQRTTFEATSSDGAHLQLAVAAGKISGTIRLANGDSRDLTAAKINNKFGIFHANGSVSGTNYDADWIVLDNDHIRGALSRGGVVIAAPRPNLTTNTVGFAAGATLAVVRVSPPSATNTTAGGPRPVSGQLGVGFQLGGH